MMPHRPGGHSHRLGHLNQAAQGDLELSRTAASAVTSMVITDRRSSSRSLPELLDMTAPYGLSINARAVWILRFWVGIQTSHLLNRRRSGSGGCRLAPRRFNFHFPRKRQ